MKKIIYKQAVLLVFVSYVPYNVVDVAAAVIQDLLPTFNFTSTVIRVR
jgi:hypothetical protein